MVLSELEKPPDKAEIPCFTIERVRNVQTCVYFGRDHHAQDVASSEMFKHTKRLENFKMTWNEKIGCYCVEGEATKREFRRLADTARTLGCKVTQTNRE